MNILSLFDGISVGQLAAREAGLKVDKYFASETDKYAMRVTQKHFPDTIQLGDVTQVDPHSLPKIDLLLAGSPCQGFSNAGKGLNFNDPRSALFFEFIRIKEVLQRRNPDMLFLLENVKMKKEWENTISEHVGIYPVEINSALVSAQQRKRLYWTNIRTRKISLFGHLISDIPQPEDLHVYLKDIIENGYTEKEKSYMVDSRQGHTSGVSADRYLRKHGRQIIWKNRRVAEKYYLSAAAKKRISRRNWSSPQVNPEKVGTLTAKKVGAPDFLILDTDGNIKPDQRKINALLAGGNGSGNHNDMDVLFEAGQARDVPVFIGTVNTGTQGNRIYFIVGKATAVTCGGGGASLGTGSLIESGGDFRRLTPLECERAQTLPDRYTEGLSDRQRYKCCGNSWTMKAIKHILSYVEEGCKK